MAEQTKAFKSSKKGYKAEKKGKYWSFTCACGSEMWDNRYKKKTEKSPDLRCKDDACSKGTKGNPNAVWLDKAEKDRLGMKDTGGKSSGSYKKGGNYGNDIQISMYAKWAHEQALYLAKETGVKSHDDLDKLYRTCLQNVGATLEWYKSKVEKKATPEAEQVKDVDDIDDTLDIDETKVEDPEDVDEGSLDDLDDTKDAGEKDVSEEGFDGLEDVDL